MDVLLRTRDTIEGGVRGVFDVIRALKCKLKKPSFILSIAANYHPESHFNPFWCDIFISDLIGAKETLFMKFILVPQNIRKMNSNFQTLEELN